MPLYINVKSNYRPNTIKNLTESISRRINKLSSAKSVLYLTMLKIFIIMYYLTVVLKIRLNSIQIVTRISVEVRTGKKKSFDSILHIVAMLSPTLVKPHKLYKIFNWNNVKISYSSMPNFFSIINSHNKKIINKLSAPTCNWR